MSTGGTVEELDAQADALDGAVALHQAVVRDAEEHAVAYPTIEAWPDIAALHREIIAEYETEIRLLRAESKLIPRQREGD